MPRSFERQLSRLIGALSARFALHARGETSRGELETAATALARFLAQSGLPPEDAITTIQEDVPWDFLEQVPWSEQRAGDPQTITNEVIRSSIAEYLRAREAANTGGPRRE
jgi:hypothetical protein